MKEQIIAYLKNANGYLSGEEISRCHHISRTGIWKNINELRKIGYEIEAVPHLGYRLFSCPDKLLPWEIQYKLNTKIFGKNIYYHETLNSTMDEAFRLGTQGAPEGTVVCAESQSNGRGRMGRVWNSPKSKGIYMSAILRPQLPPGEVAKLTLLCAVAVCEALNRVADVETRIKWPNDILVDQKKLAGILTELRAEVDQVKFVIVGVGLNINTSARQLPEEATSLKLLKGKSFSRVDVFKAILQSLEQWYGTLEKRGFAEVLEKWKELSATIGKRVRVTDAGEHIEGEACDLAQDGGLLIRSDSGDMIKKMSGDVVLVG